MKPRFMGLVIALTLLLASAQAQEPNQKGTVAIIDDLVCITMLLPGEVPWYETLALFSDAIGQLNETLKEAGGGHVPMDTFNRLNEVGIKTDTGLAYAWGYRIGGLNAEQIAELGPEPWAWLSPTNSINVGALLPTSGATPYPAVEMTLSWPRMPPTSVVG